MAIDYALAKRLHRKHKAALTRARKKGPEAVVGACRAFVREWDEALLPWPDDWHTWNVAYSDATWALERSFGNLDDLR